MATRNFWIEANIDGRKTPLLGGPLAKDGGFDLAVYIRNDGESEKALQLRGVAEEDGTLVLLGWTIDAQDFRLTRRR